MRLHHVLLVTMTTLLASTSALLSTGTTKPLKFGQISNQGRYLRHAIISNKHVEERGKLNPLSFLSMFSPNVPIGVKLQWWQTLGKSNNYVKKKLGLYGLEGTELKTHKTTDSTRVMWRRL
ncbi:hypothetical protein PI124_g14492 [Phytophthora idaei]|nr:hypothetical protein PI125_g21348 [Phytophthora idaei]KAG3132765.1 hypothetical protein PI126_g19502 [Phytophthora idaei]KAG3240622.1 hypothetical protein PI124_g14492 [Phytophthora idaei]